MRRLVALFAFALAACPAASHAATSVNVSIGIGSAPPPPVVVVREEPHVVIVPGSAVYVVSDRRWDYDCFRYGVYWYAYRGGHWYRARIWRGPYVAVVAGAVPRAIISVPARHWKHHPHGMPPGLAKKRGDVVTVKRDDRIKVKSKGHDDRHDHDRGPGKGKGHR